MNNYSCWRCNYKITFGQICPRCSQVDAINNQTKQLAKLSQPTQPAAQSNSSNGDVYAWAIGIAVVYWIATWVWQGIVIVGIFIADYHWWFIGLVVAVIAGILYNRQK